VKVVKATEAKNRFGVLLESCADSPVAVERHGRVVAYLVAPKDFKPSAERLFDSIASRLRSLGVVYATVFGSVAGGTAGNTSDIDVSVSIGKPLRSGRRMTLISEIAEVSGRSVDLIDLESTGGLIYSRAMQGTEIVCDRVTTRQRLIAKLIRSEDDRRVSRIASAVARPRLFA
jgi:predicted nucleotidyltransferase